MEDWYSMNDEELKETLEETEDDAMLMALAEMIEEEESRPALINLSGVAKLIDAYNMLYESMDGEKPEITYKIHKPFKSFGSINIVCRDLVITKTGGFGKAVQLASNCEIYPRTDGNICISLGFNGLTKPIC